MYLNKAIENGNDGITIFKDGKVFAKARKATQREGDVGIHLLPEYEYLIPDLGVDLPKKWVFLHYCAFSGRFLHAFVDTPEIDAIFEDTLAVDSFNLRFGMVPEHFKNCEGYNSIHDFVEASVF